jgi:hypothetical protein
MDTFTFAETDDIRTDGALAFYLNNSGGRDTINISYSGALGGVLITIIGGGSGRETVDSDYSFIAGSDGFNDGFFNANYDMGAGNDTVTLSATVLPGSTATVLALVDGDDGTDTCTVTPNVSSVDCEN